jgi:hypothetical protein
MVPKKQAAPSRRQTAKVQPPAQIDAHQRYSLAEANAILRQSAAKTFSDIRQGKLRVFKDGARTYVTGAELIRRSAPPLDGAQAA